MLWGIVGILAGAAVAYYFYRLTRLKLVDYSVKADEAIVTEAAKRAGSQLIVSWSDTVLREPRVATIRIANTGALAVRKDDYHNLQRPIVVTQPGNTIVAAALGAVSEVDVELLPHSASGREVVITPGHFNSRAWFDVQLISDGPGGGFEVFSKFADQSSSPYPVALERPYGQRWISGAWFRLYFGLGTTSILSMVAVAGVASLRYKDAEAVPPGYSYGVAIALLFAYGCVLPLIALIVWEESLMLRARRIMRATPKDSEPPVPSTPLKRLTRRLWIWLQRPV